MALAAEYRNLPSLHRQGLTEEAIPCQPNHTGALTNWTSYLSSFLLLFVPFCTRWQFLTLFFTVANNAKNPKVEF